MNTLKNMTMGVFSRLKAKRYEPNKIKNITSNKTKGASKFSYISVEYDKYTFSADTKRNEVIVFIHDDNQETIENNFENKKELLNCFFRSIKDWITGDNAEDDEFNEVD